MEKTEKLLKKVEAVPVVFKFVGSGTPKGPSIPSWVINAIFTTKCDISVKNLPGGGLVFCQ